MPEHAPQSSEYLSTLEAARLTGLSPAWFERSRWSGTGPPYVKLERSVKYPVRELHAFMLSRLRTSTTDDGAEASTSAPSHVGS
jgi:predicted DNA-binding transcriptional regulator AlpA